MDNKLLTSTLTFKKEGMLLIDFKTNSKKIGNGIIKVIIFLFLLSYSNLFAQANKDFIPSAPGLMQPYERFGKIYNPIEPEKADSYIERGIASWYGEDFHNYKTSTGEIYNMYDMTAAHKTLPLGLYVKVRNLKNNKECVVRLNDRGPFVDGRIIDLSYKAALKLDIIKKGTELVEIEVLGFPDERDGQIVFVKPSSYFAGTFSIQVASFKMIENAERLKNQFIKDGVKAKIVEFRKNDELFYRVRVGEFNSIEEAKLYQEELKKFGFKQTYLVGE